MDKRIILKTYLAIVVIGSVFATVTIYAANILYVDDDAVGANDGSSWENAYVYLQDALTDAADKPIEIRVAAGYNMVAVLSPIRIIKQIIRIYHCNIITIQVAA